MDDYEWWATDKSEEETIEIYCNEYRIQDISIDPQLLKKVTEHCQKEDRSSSWVIKKALESYLVA
jgi:hypothetical protein